MSCIVGAPEPTPYKIRDRRAEVSIAFSLVELVLVIAILSIIAAIAVPRVTRASKDAQANALLQTLEVVRSAVDHYFAEHGKYPGYDPDTGAVANQWFTDQLVMFSDLAGDVSRTPSSTHVFGPYLREPFPTNPFNDKSNVRVRATSATVVAKNISGWIATLDNGEFILNADADRLIEIGVAEKIANESVAFPKVGGMEVGMGVGGT